MVRVTDRTFDIQNSKRTKSLIFRFNSKLSTKELDLTSVSKNNFRSDFRNAVDIL